ncbi:MAG: hypothetical protein ACKO7P_10680, partial [Bacteroidota bacterium]
IDLLKQGINKVQQKDKASLYQKLAAVLSEEERTIEAINVLRQGMASIAPSQPQYKGIAESAMLYCIGIVNVDIFEEILTDLGKNSINSISLEMGKVLKLQMQQQWENSAEVAHQQIIRFPSKNFLRHEVFSWLCSGNSQKAEKALLSYPKSINYSKGESIVWLKTFIAIKNDDLPNTKKNLEVYLGRSLEESEKIDIDFLLELWNHSVTFKGVGSIAFYFPTLPPSLTGFKQPITRSQSKTPLDLSRYKSSSTPERETTLKVAETTTQNPVIVQPVLSPNLNTKTIMENFKNLPLIGKIGIGISLTILIIAGVVKVPEIFSKEQTEQVEKLIDYHIIVKDNNGNFLDGVAVTFTPKGSPIKKYTNTDGYVKIELPSINSIDIRLTKDKFKSATYTIDIKNDPNHDREYRMQPIGKLP